MVGTDSCAPREPRAHFSPSGGCQRAIADQLDAATSEILVAMYMFNQEALADALLRARRRGVSVQLVLDRHQRTDPKCPWRRLEAAGAVVRFIKGPGKLHHKFCIVDRRMVLTGSYNWIARAERLNDEDLVVIPDEGLARAYAATWAALPAARPSGLSTAGPTNSRSAYQPLFSRHGGILKTLVAEMDAAQTEVLVAMFVFTSKELAEACIRAKRRGVHVRVLLDAHGATHPDSLHEPLRAAGVDVALSRSAGNVHHKFAILDHRLLFAGSYNWMEESESLNHENLVMVSHSVVVKAYHDHWERLRMRTALAAIGSAAAGGGRGSCHATRYAPIGSAGGGW